MAGGPMRHGGGVATGPKAKNIKQSVGKLIKFCKPYRVQLLVAMVFAMTASICTIIGPTFIKHLTDTVEKGLFSSIDLDAILNSCIVLTILYSANFLMNVTQSQLITHSTQNISKMLRSDISKKINILPVSYYNKTSFGDVLSRVTNDVDLIGETMQRSVAQFSQAGALLIGSLVMMIITNPIMAGTAVLASVLGFSLTAVIMSHSQKYFTKKQQTLGKLNGFIEEIYSGHNIVKAYNAQSVMKGKFETMNTTLYESNWKSQFLSGLMMPIMGFVGNLGYLAVCTVGAVLVVKGSVTFGTIVAFMIYVRLFTNPLSQLAQVGTSVQMAAAASERVFEFLEEKEMEKESGKTEWLENIKGDVTFENVKFGYEDSDKIVIKDFSEHVEAGQKIAIVGPTGAGKTTLVNLLMRFHEINSGEIKIDGVPISSLSRENIHALFGMVLQDTWVFEGSFCDNIIYAKKGATKEDVVKACKAVGLHHFIKTLPHGYDTIISDKVSLSQGQKQLVTIARAMVENAPLLILDEATSSIDTRTEVLIQSAMDKLTEGRTSFVIAHRLSTIKNADVILVLKDGDILETGNHEELLAKGGFYAELYNSQFEQ